MWKWKGFNPESWAAFLSSLVRLKKASDENASTASELGKDFATLAELTAHDIGLLDEKKVDKTDVDAIIHGLHVAVFAGEVPAPLYSKDGEAITTDGGAEIFAIKKFIAERSG